MEKQVNSLNQAAVVKDTDSSPRVLGRQELDGAVTFGATVLHLDLGELHLAAVHELLLQVLPRHRERQLQQQFMNKSTLSYIYLIT